MNCLEMNTQLESLSFITYFYDFSARKLATKVLF